MFFLTDTSYLTILSLVYILTLITMTLNKWSLKLKLLWAALMAAVTLQTSASLAQTVWENFSKKKLDKFENIVHKQQRTSTDVADAATTHHMGKR